MAEHKNFLWRILEYLESLLRKDHWWAEFWAGLFLLLWGIAVHITDKDAGAAQAYEFFLRRASISTSLQIPREMLAKVSVTIGGLQLISLIFGTFYFRILTAFFNCWFCFFITCGMFLLQDISPTIAATFIFVLIDAFALVKLAKLSDG